MADKKFELLIKTAVAWWIDPLLLLAKTNFIVQQYEIAGKIKALEDLLTKHLEKQSETEVHCILSTMYGSKNVLLEFLKAVEISDNYLPTQTVMLINYSTINAKIGQDQIFPAVTQAA